MRIHHLSNMLEQLSRGVPGFSDSSGEYRSFYHWVFKNGVPQESKALTKSEWRLIHTNIHYTRQSHCFSNCQRTVLYPIFNHINSVVDGRLIVLSPFSYVEGYVLSHDIPIPIHHAWLLLNGKVVDPTLRTKEYVGRYLPDLVMGQFPADREYYGSVIPWVDVARCLKKNLSWQSVLDDWENGFPLMKSSR